jgi:opine dehydrogenase
MLKVCICGGGNLAHALAAVAASNPGVRVRILTRRPELWGAEIRAGFQDMVVIGRPSMVTADAAAAIAGAQLVLIAAPAFAHRDILASIRAHVTLGVWIGALPAPGFFDWTAAALLGGRARIFGSQRSPYNCRVAEMGSLVEIVGIVPRLAVATIPGADFSELAEMIAGAFGLVVDKLDNFLCVTLAPSPSIFHSSRLYAFLRSWDGSPLSKEPLFYEDWDDDASEIYLACDAELQGLCNALPLDMSGIPPAHSYYGTYSVLSLTRRIRGLQGLCGIPMPTRTLNGLRYPDLGNRIFREDFPFGLRAIRATAKLSNVATPMLDLIDAWSQSPPVVTPAGNHAHDCTAAIRSCSLGDLISRSTS